MQLEDELGVKLFERAHRKVALTAAGRIFLADAQRTIAAADASVRHARETSDGLRGELRIAFIRGAMFMMLPPVLREYRNRFPDVTVEPHATHYIHHVPALHAGTIDIAWTIAQPDPEIASQPIAQDTLLVALPSDHKLASEHAVDIGRLGDDPLVVIERTVSPQLHDETLRLCLEHGYRPSRLIEVAEEDSVLGLVAAGFGVALVPHPWSVIRITGIAFRPFPQTTSITQSLIWHRDHETATTRAFVATTLELMQPGGLLDWGRIRAI